jgi:hypothetical protein
MSTSFALGAIPFLCSITADKIFSEKAVARALETHGIGAAAGYVT